MIGKTGRGTHIYDINDTPTTNSSLYFLTGTGVGNRKVVAEHRTGLVHRNPGIVITRTFRSTPLVANKDFSYPADDPYLIYDSAERQ